MCEDGGRAGAIDPAPMSSGLGGEKLEATSGKAQRDGSHVGVALGMRL